MQHHFSTQLQNNVKNALKTPRGFPLFHNALKQVNSALKDKFLIKTPKNAKLKPLAYQMKFTIHLQVNVILSDLLDKSVCALQNPLFGTLRTSYVRNVQFNSLIGMPQ